MNKDAFLGFIIVTSSYFLGCTVTAFVFDQKFTGSLSGATAVALLLAYRLVKVHEGEKEKRNEEGHEKSKLL